MRAHATYGVHHSNVRHTSRYTVVGNHLLQNPALSLTARGLGAYIQSLRPGTPVSIKELVKRVPEGEIRISAALRELEAHGYLKRFREQLPDGRIVTRTVSYNHPKATATTARAERPPAGPPAPEPEPAVEPEPEPAPVAEEPSAERRAAAALLAELRRTDHRLLLGRRDIERLAPGVEVWMRRGATGEAIVSVLTANVPDPVLNPGGLIAHRLGVQEPPELAPAFRRAAHVPPDPFQTCDRCDRAFRSPVPGLCGSCTDAVADGGPARPAPPQPGPYRVRLGTDTHDTGPGRDDPGGTPRPREHR
ncbi:helix-turn-helix domain-containing protein [Streptomyces sp. NPDC090077]|uniref:helix-turn-helix domain-containing protein n=1 Tax=Streptomyces sp. NPDC090077 TaxID=3365938 RepID=UPI00380F150B